MIVVVGSGLRSASGDGGQPGERGGELAGPGPGSREAQDGLAGVEGQSPGGVQQAVASRLGSQRASSPVRQRVWQ